MQLYQRVIKIARELSTSIPGLAQKIGKEYPTFRAYLNPRREHNLWPLLPEILKCHPEVNDVWLYLGRGPMLKADDAPPELSAINREGRYTGDLLDAALGLLRLDPQKAAQALGWGIPDIRLLLESRTKPSFDQLENMYFVLGINPVYFFDGNEHTMHRPSDALLQAFYACGRIYTEPDALSVSEMFGVEKKDAERFLEQWRSAREKGKNISLPEHWLDALETMYRLNPMWLAKGTLPILRRVQNSFPPAEKVERQRISLADTSVQSDEESYRPGETEQCVENLRLEIERLQKDISVRDELITVYRKHLASLEAQEASRVETIEKENVELKRRLERQDENTAKAVGADG